MRKGSRRDGKDWPLRGVQIGKKFPLLIALLPNPWQTTGHLAFKRHTSFVILLFRLIELQLKTQEHFTWAGKLLSIGLVYERLFTIPDSFTMDSVYVPGSDNPCFCGTDVLVLSVLSEQRGSVYRGNHAPCSEDAEYTAVPQLRELFSRLPEARMRDDFDQDMAGDTPEMVERTPRSLDNTFVRLF